MKIKKISIKNYRGIEELVLQPEKTNIFVGLNGTGKSSTINAIRFAFIGKATPEDIKKGEKKCSVLVEFQDGTTLLRERTLKGVSNKVNGAVVTGKVATEFIEDKIEASTKMFDAMSSIDFIKSLDNKGLAELFLSMLPTSVDKDGFLKLAEVLKGSPLSTQAKNLDSIYHSDLSDYIKSQLPDGDFSLKEIEAAYASVYNERKLLNRELKVLAGKTLFEKELPSETKEELTNRLYILAAEEQKIIDSQRLLSEYNRQLNSQNQAKERLAKLKEEAAKYKNVLVPNEGAYLKAQSDKSQFEAAKKQSYETIATLEANVKLFNNTLNNLDKPVCPISEKLICTTDKSKIKDELQKAVADNMSAINSQNEFIAKCNDQILKRDERIQNFNNSKLEYTKRVQLEKQIYEFVIPEVPEKPEIPASQDFSALKAEINQKISVLNLYEEVEKNRKEKETLNKKLKCIEDALFLFDSKTGVRALILERVLKPLTDLCNEKAGSLRPGFEIAFNCENGIEVMVRPKLNHHFVNANTVSAGEYMFVAYLLMSCLQAITNVKYMIVDNLDKLDKQSFENFIGLVNQDSDFDNVFLAVVNHSDLQAVCKDTDSLNAIFM